MGKETVLSTSEDIKDKYSEKILPKNGGNKEHLIEENHAEPCRSDRRKCTILEIGIDLGPDNFAPI